MKLFRGYRGKPCARFEVFTAAKIQVEVFWIVMPCRVAVGYQHFGRPCCLHLQGEVFQGPLKHYYPTTTLLGFTTQKTSS
jgi:hypothetical protein